MNKEFSVEKKALKKVLEKEIKKKTSLLEGFQFPAQGDLVELAEEVLSDFENTSILVIGACKSKERVIGRFGLGYDPTPFLVAIFNWLLNKVLDLILKRRKVKDRTKPLTKTELNEIRQLVLEFGDKLEDKEIFTAENKERIADSIVRVLSQHPEALLRR